MNDNNEQIEKRTDSQITGFEKGGRFLIGTSEDVDELQASGEWIATTTPAPLRRWL